MQIRVISFALLCLLVSVISARERIESERGDKALEQFQKVVDIISTLAPIFRDDDQLPRRRIHKVPELNGGGGWDEDEMPYGMPPFRRWSPNDEWNLQFPQKPIGMPPFSRSSYDDEWNLKFPQKPIGMPPFPGRKYYDEDTLRDYMRLISIPYSEEQDDSDMVWQFPTVRETRPRGYPYDEEDSFNIFGKMDRARRLSQHHKSRKYGRKASSVSENDVLEAMKLFF